MAIMLRQINAEIANLKHEYISPTKILVRGDIEKQIIYVANNEVVRHQNEILPFTVTLELLGLTPGTEITVTATIEHISPRLIHNGQVVEQQIIVKLTITPTVGGPAVSQQFLVRSETIVEEPQEAEEPQITLSEVSLTNQENIAVESLELTDEAEQEVIPEPNLAALLEARLQVIEDQIRFELESSLRSQMRAEMEFEIQTRLADELRRKESEAQEAERKKQEELATYHKELARKSALQQLYGFKAKG